jgi:two-component system, cell cycle response regulator DivK
VQNTKTILIAEDSSVILTLTKKILELQHYQIETVKNGRDVVKKAEAKHPDLILLDINLPYLDGMQCARQIRSHSDKALANVPIVAITGNAMNYTIEQFKEAGINSFVPKPLNYDQLVTVIQEHIGKE